MRIHIKQGLVFGSRVAVFMSLLFSNVSYAGGTWFLNSEDSLYAYTGGADFDDWENPSDDIENENDFVDEESVQQQAERKEEDQENPPDVYSPLSERDAEEEVEASAQEQREGYYAIGSFLDRRGKTSVGYGLSYSLYESPGTMHSMYLGFGASEFSNAEDGYSYESDFATYAIGYDYSILPIKRIPLKFAAGASLTYLDGGISDASALDGSFTKAKGSYTRTLLSLYGSIGFLKTLYNGFYFGIELITIAQPLSLGGEDSDLGDKLQDSIDDDLTTFRIVPPLNFTFGYFF